MEFLGKVCSNIIQFVWQSIHCLGILNMITDGLHNKIIEGFFNNIFISKIITSRHDVILARD